MPHYSFARINLIIKHPLEIEEKEFNFILATAIQQIHGEFANQLDVLTFQVVDSENYSAIIKFKTIHHSRLITSLLLFGNYKAKDCRFDIIKVAQTPCFLSLQDEAII